MENQSADVNDFATETKQGIIWDAKNSKFEAY